MSDSSIAHSENANSAAAPRKPVTEAEQRREEWYALYSQLDEFMKQEPQKHPLYDFARESLVSGESCDFYRGAVEDACKVMRIVDACKTATEEKNKALGEEKFRWEDMLSDMMRIRIGLNAKRALQRWPAKFVPNVLVDKEAEKDDSKVHSSSN